MFCHRLHRPVGVLYHLALSLLYAQLVNPVAQLAIFRLLQPCLQHISLHIHVVCHGGQRLVAIQISSCCCPSLCRPLYALAVFIAQRHLGVVVLHALLSLFHALCVLADAVAMKAAGTIIYNGKEGTGKYREHPSLLEDGYGYKQGDDGQHGYAAPHPSQQVVAFVVKVFLYGTLHAQVTLEQEQ